MIVSWFRKWLLSSPYTQENLDNTLIEVCMAFQDSNRQTPSRKTHECAAELVHDKTHHTKLSLRVLEHQIKILKRVRGDHAPDKARALAKTAFAEMERLQVWMADERETLYRKHKDLLLLASCQEQYAALLPATH